MPLTEHDGLWRALASSAIERADAVRFACILEATAPKVGNVHPAARFDDLSYADFVIAADLTADAFLKCEQRNRIECVGDAILAAVTASVSATQTNVNLGIILLLGPLLAAEPEGCAASETAATRIAVWNSRVTQVLAGLDPKQGAAVAKAIASAGAGGLQDRSIGDDHSLDVTSDHGESYDILAAMRIAAPRDRIAKQYAGGFHDLFTVVVPTLAAHVARCGDLLTGIVHAHIALIAADGDSLIARKCGETQSQRVATLAQRCLQDLLTNTADEAVASLRRLDAVLRGDSNRLNPGTTADLIAAAIYVLLRVHRTL